MVQRPLTKSPHPLRYPELLNLATAEQRGRAQAQSPQTPFSSSLQLLLCNLGQFPLPLCASRHLRSKLRSSRTLGRALGPGEGLENHQSM